MSEWTETYRGSVAPWECDVTEHFTIAYYFDRLEQAEANFVGSLGLAAAVRQGGFKQRYDLRFAREMRAGAAFHVEAAVIGRDPALRLGYRFVDSANGEVTNGPARRSRSGPRRRAPRALPRPPRVGSARTSSMKTAASGSARSFTNSPIRRCRPAPRSG